MVSLFDRSLSEAYYTGDINPICWIASRDSAEGLKGTVCFVIYRIFLIKLI